MYILDFGLFFVILFTLLLILFVIIYLIIFHYYNKTTPFGVKIIQFSCFFIDFLLCTMVECDDAQGKCHGQRLHCVHIASCSGYQ